uniref:Variant surface glycoprotein 726 n=1 Tax=Trypanosoma brucei TaxID=5691 RepID=M4SV71_9TRYP|nr:variant surface glycoprotein 726 [Trypanosoma brucei]
MLSKQEFALRLGLIALSVLAQSALATGNAGKALTHGTWTPICEMTTNLAAVFNEQSQSLAQSIENSEANRKLTLQLSIYASQAEPAKRLKLLPLIAGIAAKAVIATDTTTQGVKLALAAAQATSFVRGRLAEFISITADSYSTSGTHGCLEKVAGTTAVEGANTLAQCALGTDTTGKAHPKAYSGDPDKLFKPDGPEHAAAARMAGTPTCNVFKTAAGGLVETAGNHKDITMAAGYLTLIQSDDSIKHATFGTLDAADAGTTPKDMHAAQIAQNNWRTSGLLTAAKKIDPDSADITTSTEFKTAVKIFFLRQAGHYDAKTDQTTVDAAIKEHYATDKDLSLKKVWKEMQAATIPKELVSPTAQQDPKLISQTNTKQLGLILLHYQAKAAFELLEQQDKIKNFAAKPVTDDRISATQKDCAAHHADRNACNGKDFCTYDETESTNKKCKYNATKATAQGVPVTQAQTGGSTGEGVKCSDHKDQPTCEKANEGKTTNVCG